MSEDSNSHTIVITDSFRIISIISFLLLGLVFIFNSVIVIFSNQIPEDVKTNVLSTLITFGIITSPIFGLMINLRYLFFKERRFTISNQIIVFQVPRYNIKIKWEDIKEIEYLIGKFNQPRRIRPLKNPTFIFKLKNETITFNIRSYEFHKKIIEKIESQIKSLALSMKLAFIKGNEIKTITPKEYTMRMMLYQRKINSLKLDQESS